MRFSLFVQRMVLMLALAATLAAPSSSAAAGLDGGRQVIAHPDGPLYVGDWVSFEVLLPGQAAETQVEVSFAGRVLGRAAVAPYGVGGRLQATFWWVWDTRGLEAGVYSLTFRIVGGEEWQETIRLNPADQVPPPEPDAHWEYATTACCTIHYITGTAAERDLAALMAMVDEQASFVEAAFGDEFEQSVTVVFLPRVLGHGGFAADGIYVSYLDRNYAGDSTESVLRHELAHVMDFQRGEWPRLSLLVEGLAVYASGGHYKPEPLGPRAAALLDLDWYIPLASLADDFYHHQHEIGYLEAGALVQYLVEAYGWEAFDAFYRQIDLPASGRQSDALDAALRRHFGRGLAEVEQDFLAWLGRQEVDEAIRADLRLTVELYDAIRRYQSLFDPSAYFLTAWLPDGAAMRERGIVADYLRHPAGWRNRVLETLLVDADRALRSGEYWRVRRNIDLVDLLLALLA